MKIPHGHKKTAVMVVLKNNNKFLLLKRKKAPNKDKFTPVGGKLEPFENPIHTAIRETREETGLVLETVKFCGTLVESSPTKYNWICFIYLAEIADVTPPDCNEGTLEWIDFENLLKVPTPPTDWFIYKYLLKEKPFAFNATFDENLQLISLIEEIETRTVFEK